jgi:hypothetical protein
MMSSYLTNFNNQMKKGLVYYFFLYKVKPFLSFKFMICLPESEFDEDIRSLKELCYIFMS